MKIYSSYNNNFKNNKCGNCNNCKCKKDSFSKEMERFEKIAEYQFKVDSTIRILEEHIKELNNIINVLKGS